MPDAPRRIQRSRAKGWMMPPNTVYVGRGSRWGNPVRVGDRDRRTLGIIGPAEAVEGYLRRLVTGQIRCSEADVIWHLRGKNLACWCALDQPCHADVLLELANAPLRCEAVDG
jgi:hypothetical protein